MFFVCTLFYAAISILIFLPSALAARSIVSSVTEGLSGSSNHSNAERLVFIRLAN